MLLRGDPQIREYIGRELLGREKPLSREAWRKRRLAHPDLYGCTETQSFGAGLGYQNCFETTSLDWAEPIVAERTRKERHEAARKRWGAGTTAPAGVLMAVAA
jgi:hypothetical protein